MAEPGPITAVALAGGATVGIMTNFNPECAIGAMLGALLYFMWAQEVPMVKRLVYFLISFIMGYLFAPLISKASITLPFLGTFGPIDLPGPAAFLGAAFIVSVTLAILRGRGQGVANEG